MDQRASRLSRSECIELWRRWRQGETVQQISIGLHRHHATVKSLVHERGGIAPRPRKRSARALSLQEREEISRCLEAQLTGRAIAARLKRSPATISREIARNAGREVYRACRAEDRAWEQARRPKRCKLARNRSLCRQVASKLLLQWSPQQISAWLAERYPHDHSKRVSHESIYRTLFIQARGVLKKELTAHLRSQRQLRQRAGRHASALEGRPGQIVGACSIRERPAEAEDRAIPGHWEGDLLCGANSSQIATLVERQSRYVMLLKLPSKHSKTMVDALSKRVLTLPAQLRKSLTWDRGLEMADHKRFTVATDVKVYFCDPRSPWQRGSNENTNGLLRQYFPRDTDLSVHSQAHLDAIALRLNQRPRQTLGWKAPADKLNATLVALTG